MSPGTIGDRELDLLRWVSERGGASVREASEGFGGPRGLARSTVLTMMERLRTKGLLDRRHEGGGAYRYRPTEEPEALLSGIVGSFVDRTLGGSVSPFVQYLTERKRVSDAELAELERLVAELKARRKKGR